jgi:hypothetical protein
MNHIKKLLFSSTKKVEEDIEDLDSESDSNNNEEDIDLNEDEDSCSDTDNNLFQDAFLLDECIVGDGIERKLYKMSFKTYHSFSSAWKMNRPIDQKHVNYLYEDLKQMKYPYFIGTMKAIQTPNSILTIDGQHREAAFNKMRDDNILFDMNIYLEVYNCDNNDENDIEAIRLFINANKNKPINQEDMPNICYKNAIDKLREDSIYAENIIIKDMGNVYSPKITYKEFYNKLQFYCKDKTSFTVDELVNEIKKINLEFSKMKKWELMGGISGKEIAKNKKLSYEKACKNGFYLNLPKSKYPIDTWMAKL